MRSSITWFDRFIVNDMNILWFWCKVITDITLCYLSDIWNWLPKSDPCMTFNVKYIQFGGWSCYGDDSHIYVMFCIIWYDRFKIEDIYTCTIWLWCKLINDCTFHVTYSIPYKKAINAYKLSMIEKWSGVFFDLHLNKRLSKQSRGWWFEMPSCSLWRHFNVYRKSLTS